MLRGEGGVVVVFSGEKREKLRFETNGQTDRAKVQGFSCDLSS